MNGGTLASAGALAAPEVTFAVLAAVSVLLIARMVVRETNVDVTATVRRLLDGSIAVLVVLFLALVLVRFVTIA